MLSPHPAAPDYEINGPTFSELGMYLVLAPIVAEFDSDPMSVQCFDIRLVRRAQKVVRDFEGTFGAWMTKHPHEVREIGQYMLDTDPK